MSEFLTSPSPHLTTEGGRRLFNWDEMEGKTIRCVCECPNGKRGNQIEAVIIFDDDCWATVLADTDGCGEGAHLSLAEHYGNKNMLPDYMTPKQMLEARMVNHGQYEYLEKKKDEAEKAEKLERAARLRKQAEELEKS